jgi:hypothetical protein
MVDVATADDFVGVAVRRIGRIVRSARAVGKRSAAPGYQGHSIPPDPAAFGISLPAGAVTGQAWRAVGRLSCCWRPVAVDERRSHRWTAGFRDPR